MRAFLDTTALFGQNLRNFLLWTAFVGGFFPLWTDEILDELDRNLEEHLGIDAERRLRLRQEMARAFPDSCFPASTSGNGYGISDPDDVHVIDSAVDLGADVLVTDDSHFTDTVMQTAGLLRMATVEFAADRLTALSEGQLRGLAHGFGDASKLSSFPALENAYALRLSGIGIPSTP